MQHQDDEIVQSLLLRICNQIRNPQAPIEYESVDELHSKKRRRIPLVASAICLCVAIVASASILAINKPLVLDGVSISDQELEHIRGYRQFSELVNKSQEPSIDHRIVERTLELLKKKESTHAVSTSKGED